MAHHDSPGADDNAHRPAHPVGTNPLHTVCDFNLRLVRLTETRPIEGDVVSYVPFAVWKSVAATIAQTEAQTELREIAGTIVKPRLIT